MKLRICELLAIAAFVFCFLVSAQPLAQNSDMQRTCEDMQRMYDQCSKMAAEQCNSLLKTQTDPYTRRIIERSPPCSSFPSCERIKSYMWQAGCP